MKATKSLLCLMGATLMLSSLGCVKKSSYGIVPLEHETSLGELDATWFERDVWEKGEIVAIELVYCPMVPQASTVCRTAVVWRKNSSALVDAAGGSFAPEPSASTPR